MNGKWMLRIAAIAMPLLCGSAVLALEPAAPAHSGLDEEALTPETSKLVLRPPKDLEDVAISTDPALEESYPSVAANPRIPRRLVAAAVSGPAGSFAKACVVYRSGDSGKTWSQPIELPTASFGCHRPLLTYASDGSRLYAAYGRVFVEDVTGNNYVDIFVSYSDDDGRNWSSPVLILASQPPSRTYGPDTYAITAPLKRDRNWVYLVAGLYEGARGGGLSFVGSGDQGVTWSEQTVLPAERDERASAFAPTVAAGAQGDVLVAWFDSSGPAATVRVAASADHGRTFGAATTAAGDGAYPAVQIDDAGEAHIAYQGGNQDSIRHVRSVAPPYETWSSPVTVNDDGAGHHHILPMLKTQRCGHNAVLHLVWVDDRFGDVGNVFYARKLTNQPQWSKNIRVSDQSSVNPLFAIGLAISKSDSFTVWSPSLAQDWVIQTHVRGSGIDSGVTCSQSPR